MFGGNDDHGFMTGLPEGSGVGPFGSASWTAEYRRRVGVIMDSATRNGAHLVWIGLPITNDVEQTRRFDAINAIVQTEAAKRPRPRVLPRHVLPTSPAPTAATRSTSRPPRASS